jgi:hypothetical protein
MSKKREAFNFYKSYYDVFKMLDSDKDKLLFIKALLERQFEGVEPEELKGQVLFAYTSQKHSIDRQVEGWESKTKQKLHPLNTPLNTPPTEPPYQQGEEEEKEKGEEETKVAVDKSTTFKTLKERQIDFGKELKTYVDKYGNTMCKEFFDYWTESNANGKKMRFEMEKVFDLKRRLATWKSRQKNFNKEPEIDQLVINVNKAVGL